ncbi:GNAT family N-acetyltransferase [Actinopolymorpha pittospori]
MTSLSDQHPVDDLTLFERQVRTLVASWARYATGSAGAQVREEDGATICTFPSEPERLVYNNALIARGLDGTATVAAIEAIERTYREAGIDQYAAWAHESDQATIVELYERGYTLDTSTRAMAMPLDDLAVPRPEVHLGESGWSEYLRIVGVPDGLLQDMDTNDFHVLIARLNRHNVATAMAYDHDGDCGIYNVATVPNARRRGLGTALTALHVHRAKERGCTTASLQSTKIAERVYASVGFRDLGRFLEYVK